ncbi:MAG: transposase [Wolbachia sp.]
MFLYREYARAPRGEKIYADVPGKKRERVSIIGGWIEKKFIAPMTFTGGFNKDVFNVWLERTTIAYFNISEYRLFQTPIRGHHIL